VSFSVEPGALEQGSVRLGDAAADVQTAATYIRKHTELGFGTEGIINRAWGAHEELVSQMHTRLTHLTDVLEKSQAALKRTAEYYRATDDRSASRLDATYPEATRSEDTMAGERPERRYQSD
jgi:uncharacterized protein YukE